MAMVLQETAPGFNVCRPNNKEDFGDKAAAFCEICQQVRHKLCLNKIMAHTRTEAAFTRRELVVVIVVLFVLGALFIPALQRPHRRSSRIGCVNNLKQIGLAYRIWSNDNGDHFPANAPLTNGGWRELLSRANAGTYAWTNYATMSNEMGQAPMILACPADERKAASSFNNLANTNISYFVCVSANDTYPQSILGGDRNLGPGTTPDPEYGYSPADGKGNDVIINGPVCWSLKMHSRGNAAGAGNILLGDGSAQQATSGNLSQNWVKPAFTNAATFSNATNPPAMRLIFP
jgi:competence protein ComGC